MGLLELLAAVLTGLGLYILLNSLLHPHSLQAVQALQRLSGRKISWQDRLIFPLARRIAPAIHLAPYRHQELSSNLSVTGSHLTPEQYTAQTLIIAVLIALWGFVLLPASYLFTIIMGIYAIYWYSKQKSGLTASAQRRRSLREAALPRFVSYLIQTVPEQHDLYTVIAGYRPTAEPELGRELDTLLIEMRTGNVDDALYRFADRMAMPLLTDLMAGLVAASHGENVQDYLLSLSDRISEMKKVQLKAEVDKRESLFTVPNFVMIGSVVAVMMTALGVYCYQMLKAI